MRKIPVKLTQKEIVLPPGVTAKNRARLEEMNKEGLLARNAGGVAAYRANGGAVAPPKPSGLGQYLTDNSNAVGKLGRSLVAIGQRDFAGASDALTPEAVDKDSSDQSAKQKALRESDKQVVILAQEARGLLTSAAQAGDYINGYAELPENLTKKLNDAEKSWTDKAKDIGGSLLDLGQSAVGVGLGAFDQTRRVRDEARRRIVSASYPDSYRAYQRLTLLANQMVLPILASGALGVNPTDADVKLAKETQFDIAAPSNTWDIQLVDLINRSGGTAEAVKRLAAKTNNEKTVADVDAGAAQVNTTAAESAQENTVAEPASEPSPVAPVEIPRTVQTILKKKIISKKLKLRALQEWAGKNDIGPDSLVIFGDTTGSYAELLADLEAL